MKSYGSAFYRERHERTIHAAERILTELLELLPPVRSAVDVGCGVGTWLSVLAKKGVTEIQGVDGPWLEKEMLEIPRGAFQEADLSAPVRLSKRFDLAISLEVAEHLPPERAAGFVGSLTALADFVLFSAAIPFQGGRNHVNEQWPEYWAALFEASGHVALDPFRRRIWNDRDIPSWYRQNTLLFVRRERARELRFLRSSGEREREEGPPLSLVHPDAYLEKAAQMTSVRGSWRLLRRAIERRIKRTFGPAGSRSPT
jgi:SAM-dependent methyltransferase